MPDFVFSPPPVIAVPVVGTDALFPVRRIYCVGRNYLEHIREMGGEERDPPFFFQKPTDAIVRSGGDVPYPPITEDFQHEIELVLAIGTGGANIVAAEAARHVFGLAVGIDLTRRDVQINARKTGRPWEIGKSFDHSAPIGAIKPLDNALPTAGDIRLMVNGEMKQSGNIDQLIWNCEEIVSQLSTQYTLQAGDLIYTGTPAGVAALNAGDQVIGQIDSLPDVQIKIT
ncbi:fumarylpyruvate hydrolase [Novosphingobium hassiacum]|uniref:Fumarylpyruvate hydrolase n=1 Tax=Novosphingobium hassiacum TaxID=173676 RepID=A0A7W6EXQ3_9SPHN|nr:fumarylacetoacetate hydrolase family protein [Novosphingobium hassiacum]MBB3862325.1 fumarylpyruvate hydrolase [Novosphingobium hassiacum]